MSYGNLKFGIFLAPFHPVRENPTAALERDMELIEYLDQLGYDYAWIGEHHSAGFEIIASPELFIAAAAQRTKHIKLGTGVSSLPYHHPLMLADRIMQLDHMTRGRVAFGVGPGALPSDAYMMGINPVEQRDMMLEAIEVLVPLLRGETVTRKTSWFELNEARLQLEPYTKPMVEMAVASQVSPAGARAAGTFGLGLLSIGATSTGGYNALATNWEIFERKAKEHNQVADRSKWSLVGPVHIAETREQAFDNVRHGINDWVRYFQEVAALPVAPQDGADPAEALVECGMAVIGTPDDAIAQIERLQEQSGGFGSFLQMAHNWADWQQTRKSYELFARYVAPCFQSANGNRAASYDWTSKNHERFMTAVGTAITKEIEKDEKEKQA
ncbi:MAG: LLM class flavin-dependent oxidoreductase [Pseudomonadales bacterium]|nr:LLM class flavin-dependent oxidoreductase [Pseudomonadales bacterium]